MRCVGIQSPASCGDAAKRTESKPVEASRAFRAIDDAFGLACILTLHVPAAVAATPGSAPLAVIWHTRRCDLRRDVQYSRPSETPLPPVLDPNSSLDGSTQGSIQAEPHGALRLAHVQLEHLDR